ncbi:hypothetical protein [Spirosoma validum]|uniref:Uncharacterized protein n=1 Tax=Spirosoma validum TaxID=2771355 RepID=A0A927AXG3_9BACT|nr:hypothetical protein [Spirosoma validum]MBD2751624.1 hypothetical protein [Spirosoma validum]
MITHEESTTLLDLTMDVLEGELADTTPQSGLGVIDRWLEQLHQTDNATDITNTLEQVKTQLKSDQITPGELSELLNTLATQTNEFSTKMGSEGDIAPRLEGVASALRSMAGQLSH